MSGLIAPDRDADGHSTRLGAKTCLLVLALYLICIGVATYPRLSRFRNRVPGDLLDVQQHLWVLKWYRTCLLNGTFPLRTTELQYPVGAPLGNFSPLHFQALLFVPLSMVLDDVAAFNAVWTLGLLSTGFGTFLLLWQVLRDRTCAAFGGMLAMLSGPVLFHAQSHLELIFAGGFPLFMAAWMRFVDRPTWGRLLASLASYLWVSTCAAYYAVFVVIPAALYVAWRFLGPDLRRDGRGLRERSAWLFGFGAVAGLMLAALFHGQFWAMSHGYTGERTLWDEGGAPIWSYILPSSRHVLAAVLPFD